jgi:hypothetical protein
MGWNDRIGDASRKTYIINLSNFSYKFEEISISNEGSADWLSGHDYKDIWYIYSEEDQMIMEILIAFFIYIFMEYRLGFVRVVDFLYIRGY